MALTGTLKKFIEEKGFGFIERDDGQGDLFVHFSKCNCEKEELVEGSKLTFDEGWNDRTSKSCAENVTLVGGGGGGGGGGYGGGKGGGKSWSPY